MHGNHRVSTGFLEPGPNGFAHPRLYQVTTCTASEFPLVTMLGIHKITLSMALETNTHEWNHD
jgi:hypothetical protein